MRAPALTLAAAFTKPRMAPGLTSVEVRRALDDPRALCHRLGLDRGARRQRSGLMILCPWHDEKTPSCSVRVAQDGTIAVHCHACGASGDALSLVAVAHRLDVRRDFRDVLSEAARIAGLDPAHLRFGAPTTIPFVGRRGPALAKVGARPATKPSASLSLAPPPEALDDPTFAAIASVLLHIGRIDEGPLSKDVALYLAQRKLLDLARAEGWAALPASGKAQAAWIEMLVSVFGRDVMERSGLLWKRGSALVFAHPEHRLIIPWRAADGAVQTLQRRRVDTITDKKYVFPAGRPARELYGLDKVRTDTTFAIVEGAADVLALRWLLSRDGIDATVVGLPGAQRWDTAWARHAGPRAILGLDADRAGHLAVGGIAHDLVLAGVAHLERWKPRIGKDWADTLRAERI
ncbi:CHC2 zinc finger domain-containing protein [Chondromyces crocatus]|uniref:CHC2 zinc finger domain-containing protein n=1 Tax=Chondromyces crocatus TaxID=52 RepID=UPI001C54E8E3|nr:CHC2 zinc finger domain-containing protein [Chondromyces crocatus]